MNRQISQLNNIRIVLVNTFHPGNIGAAARAMKTMGLSDLVLVDPVEHPSAEATSRAAGAADLLASAVIADNLTEALANRTMVFATTARGKQKFIRPEFSCKAAASLIAENSSEKIAIVFGRERSGLSADELSLCQKILFIPGSVEYNVLNMAAAVQIVCYELFQALQNPALQISAQYERNNHSKLATQKSLQSLYQQLNNDLEKVGYIQPALPTKTPQKIQQLFAKSSMTEEEVSMLRGIFKALGRTNKN